MHIPPKYHPLQLLTNNNVHSSEARWYSCTPFQDFYFIFFFFFLVLVLQCQYKPVDIQITSFCLLLHRKGVYVDIGPHSIARACIVDIGPHSPAPDKLARIYPYMALCDIDATNACDINGRGDGIANPSRSTPRFGRGACHESVLVGR